MRRVCTLLLLLWAAAASAQIYVGQTSGFSGPVAAGVKENTEGAKLYLEHVNRQGGVHGQSVMLVSVDDRFDPKLAAQNARQLITERHVVALFMNRGTPHTEAIRPLLEEFKVPLVAPSTGAMILHKPVHPWIFNVRATYQREAEKAVTHLASTGVTRIGTTPSGPTWRPAPPRPFRWRSWSPRSTRSSTARHPTSRRRWHAWRPASRRRSCSSARPGR
jgi:branched-chain amino acid transport system substrate-binding protein